MKRFLTTILTGIFVLLSCSVVCAKSVGVIMSGDIPYYQDIHKSFMDNVSGFFKEQGIEVVVQKPVPENMSWTNAARKLVTIGSEVIISYGAAATLTTMKATSDIPILFAGVYDPQAMQMTGKNATGVSSTVPVDTVLKRLSSIKKISKLGIILSKSEKDSILQTKEIKGSEGTFGFSSVLITIQDGVNKDSITGVDAIVLTTCAAAMVNVKDIIDVARRDKLLTAALLGGAENEGVVLTVMVSPEEQGKKLADIVKKVLGGSKPSDISVTQPKELVTIINMKEAQSLGITIPADVKGSATKVIE